MTSLSTTPLPQNEPLHVYASTINASEMASQNLSEYGIVQIHELQTIDTADFAKSAQDTLIQVIAALEAKGLEYKHQKEGTTSFTFSDVASRDRGRLDVRYNMTQYTQLTNHPLIHSIITSTLGKDYKEALSGIVYSLAGSVAQAWHRDGPHLSPNNPTAPTHAITCFFPLIDVTEARGSPQFIPSSHHLSDEESNSAEHRVVQFSPLPPTDVIMFDYRLIHRGMPNTGQDTRPLLYVVYSKPDWNDDINFGTEFLLPVKS